MYSIRLNILPSSLMVVQLLLILIILDLFLYAILYIYNIHIAGYSNGKKIDSKSTGNPVLTRNVGVRVPPP